MDMNATLYPSNIAALAADPIFQTMDYFKIELLPGLLTPGRFGASAALTRALLARIDVEGLRCLDIGPMEGLISALLARRGAIVTALDITCEHVTKIDYVRRYLGVSIDLHAPVHLSEAPAFFRSRTVAAFDVVVLSGVLYHVAEFVGSLANARALVRTGGLMIVETWVERGSAPIMLFNAKGAVTEEPNTFWFPTVGLLDYLLRFMSLCPVDCIHLDVEGGRLRIAVLCRATEAPVAAPGDAWMARTASSVDLPGFVRLRLPSARTEPLIGGAAINLFERVERWPSAAREDKPLLLSDLV